MLNPFQFTDDEHYLESLRIWKERDMKTFIDENPGLRPGRHEKICKYRKTLRVSIVVFSKQFVLHFPIFLGTSSSGF